MNPAEWVASVIQFLSLVALAYHVTLNGLYALLLTVSARGLNRQRRRERFAAYDVVARSAFTPPISIILPAYNEEASIAESVEALRKLDYPQTEILVVNDGSTDHTLDRLIDTFRLRPVRRITRTKEPAGEVPVGAALRGFYSSPPGEGVHDLLVIDKENGGKADALNAGIRMAQYPVCCTVDADSLLEVDALVRAIYPFLDHPEETVAAGGLVRVANGCIVEAGRVIEVGLPHKLLPRAQIVEYFRSFLGSRYGLARLHSLLILSGAFSLFRRSSLVEAGGFRREVITEDMEITCAIHVAMRNAKRAYRIDYIPDPIAWTEAPERLGHLRVQRVRWHRGLMQVLSIYRGVLARSRYGILGWFAYPYHLIFEAWGPVVEAAGYVVVPLGWALGIVEGSVFFLFLAASLLYGVLLSVFSLYLQGLSRRSYQRQLGGLAFAALIEAIALRPLLAMFRAGAVVQHLAGGKPAWGNAVRTGFSPRGHRR